MNTDCELPRNNATPDEIRRLLQTARAIAVVGLSEKPERDSYRVARYLQAHGFHIIPVNPNIAEALGEPACASLRDAGPVDIVDIFRKPEAVPGIVEDAIAIGAKAVWMQEGIAHNVAADRARAAGLHVVMNKCLMKEHRNAFGG